MNLFQLNNAINNGGAVWVSASSTVVDDDSGNALPIPDLFNDYMDNTPDEVFYE